MLAVMRFNFVLPGLDRPTLSSMYAAGVEMARYADQHGFMAVSFEEHHGAENGWSPSPLINAALAVGVTERILISISALLVPLHDPLRIAEDIAVLDLASGGRVSVIVGLGYRRSEYEAHGKDWDGRGALMDEALETMLAAWTGEPFTYRGRTVRVTPPPLSPPQQLLLVGGRTKAAARRAARLGLFFSPVAHVPDLDAYYHEQCARYGTSGFVISPSDETTFVFVAEDPDRAWAEIGPHLLHEATTYAGWQVDAVHSAAYTPATSVEQLRADGKYAILTPDECIARAQADAAAPFVLHPLCGGTPVDAGWESLRLFAERVMPAVAAAG